MATFKDSLLRLLPSSLPQSFLAMTPDEQAWRGRVFLMSWALGADDSAAWAMALNDEPEHVGHVKETVRLSDDDVIRDAVKTRRDAERAASRLGLGELR